VHPIDAEPDRREGVTDHRELEMQQIDRPRASLESGASRGTFFPTGITVELAEQASVLQELTKIKGANSSAIITCFPAIPGSSHYTSGVCPGVREVDEGDDHSAQSKDRVTACFHRRYIFSRSTFSKCGSQVWPAAHLALSSSMSLK